jgi:hypothetical protein
MEAGSGQLMVPARTIVNTEWVPAGESGAGTYSTRWALFASEYKDYQLTGAAR